MKWATINGESQTIQQEVRVVCVAISAAACKLVNDICRYILVYPQGCDVCNHLSLFLCVADYDKLLPGDIFVSMHFVSMHFVRLQQRLRRIIDKSLLLLLGTVTSTGHRILKYAMCVGWSHFAQFTIAVVNKDPKKSKYSGILIAPVTLS